MPAQSYPSIGSAAYVNISLSQTITGAKTFLAGSATSVPVTVKAFAGQTSNLTEWQDSSGAVQASINSNGRVKTPVLLVGTADVQTLIGNGQLRLITENAAERGIVVRGFASQSANLQEWQDSAGTILSRINSSGTGEFNRGLYTQGPINGSPSGGHFQIDNRQTAGSTDTIGMIIFGRTGQTANLLEIRNGAAGLMTTVGGAGNVVITADTSSPSTALFVKGQNAARNVLEVRAAASQSANVMEVQNSAGTPLFGIRSNGRLDFISTGNSVTTATAGGNGAAPASVAGYLIVHFDGTGTNYKIPYYLN